MASLIDTKDRRKDPDLISKLVGKAPIVRDFTKSPFQSNAYI